jgi:anti-anti-sigma factor
MSTCDFELTLEQRANGTMVLVLAGELDLYRAPEIEGALADAIGPERNGETPDGRASVLSDDDQTNRSRRVVVDLRFVTFLDSTTLAVLLAASGRQRARGGELLLLVGPQTPTTAFELTGLGSHLTIKRVVDSRSRELA